MNKAALLSIDSVTYYESLDYVLCYRSLSLRIKVASLA